jgi:uncharacterized membrane protein
VEVSVRIRGWWDALRDSLWMIPGASVLAAVVLAGVLTRFEPLPPWFPDALIFTGTPDGARAILAQLAGATITVTGLVFSLTVLALQMAATQFSPRLLRTFLRDRRVQIVLSAMVSSAVCARCVPPVRASLPSCPAWPSRSPCWRRSPRWGC